MTKTVLMWKIMKEVEAAKIAEKSAEKHGDHAKVTLYKGVGLGLATALEDISKYSQIEKEYKENNV